MAFQITARSAMSGFLKISSVAKATLLCHGHSPWPALEGGHHKQCQHCMHYVVVVEFTPDPLALFNYRFVDIPVREGDELALACLVVVHGQVGA